MTSKAGERLPLPLPLFASRIACTTLCLSLPPLPPLPADDVPPLPLPPIAPDDSEAPPPPLAFLGPPLVLPDDSSDDMLVRWRLNELLQRRQQIIKVKYEYSI